ncbi:MAG: manganese efflux pump [Ruminococcaceae bacterium]|nr:manganese efflux pump [Oscillospiraceae bacterium]
MIFELIVTAAALGVGLAMDAFSVSLTNGLSEPCGTKRRAAVIAGVFSLFQLAMPLIGWLLVSTVAKQFERIVPAIPYIAFGILLFIGGKMLVEGILETVEKKKARQAGEQAPVVCAMARTSFGGLIVQGIATSIDALSCGFEFADYLWWEALTAGGIIGAITLALCFSGVLIGRKFGTRLAEKATILGGSILILIGIKILVLDGILRM